MMTNVRWSVAGASTVIVLVILLLLAAWLCSPPPSKHVQYEVLHLPAGGILRILDKDEKVLESDQYVEPRTIVILREDE